MRHRLIVALLAFAVSIAISEAGAAEPRQVQAAAEKSVALLQRSGAEFFRKSGCIACHHQSVTSMAVGEARKRGLRLDENTAREQLQVTALIVKKSAGEQLDNPFNTGGAIGYFALGLSAEHHPPDQDTDTMVIEMAGRQTSEGSWTSLGHRPPLEYSRISTTALAVRAIQLYGPPGLSEAFNRRIGKARDWLVKAQPTSNSEDAFRLLGLAWAGAERQPIEAEFRILLEQQRDDGGWAQWPGLTSDAFATGLTLYALHEGGRISPDHPAYRRGVEYLMQTQLNDGSWHVKTRSYPFQPYFESGFPHGPDQWISSHATGFATVALMYAVPPAAADAR